MTKHIKITSTQINELLKLASEASEPHVRRLYLCFWYSVKHWATDCKGSSFSELYVLMSWLGEGEQRLLKKHCDYYFDFQTIIQRAEWSFNNCDDNWGANYLADSWLFILDYLGEKHAAQELKVAISGLVKPLSKEAKQAQQEEARKVLVQPEEKTFKERLEDNWKREFYSNCDTFSDADPGL